MTSRHLARPRLEGALTRERVIKGDLSQLNTDIKLHLLAQYVEDKLKEHDKLWNHDGCSRGVHQFTKSWKRWLPPYVSPNTLISSILEVAMFNKQCLRLVKQVVEKHIEAVATQQGAFQQAEQEAIRRMPQTEPPRMSQWWFDNYNEAAVQGKLEYGQFCLAQLRLDLENMERRTWLNAWGIL